MPDFSDSLGFGEALRQRFLVRGFFGERIALFDHIVGHQDEVNISGWHVCGPAHAP